MFLETLLPSLGSTLFSHLLGNIQASSASRKRKEAAGKEISYESEGRKREADITLQEAYDNARHTSGASFLRSGGLNQEFTSRAAQSYGQINQKKKDALRASGIPYKYDLMKRDQKFSPPIFKDSFWKS